MTAKQHKNQRRLHIAYCLSFFPALSETYLFNQLAALLDDGHSVTIFSIGKPASYTKHQILERHQLLQKTIYRPSIPRSKLLRILKAIYLLLINKKDTLILLKTLNIFKYGKYAANLDFFYDTIPFLQHKSFDIVHCHFGPNGIKAVNFRELGLLQGKFITSFHGYDVNKKDFLEWPSHYGRKGLYKDLIQECELFTVNSEYIKRKAELLGIPKERIALLPESTYTSIFKKNKRLNGLHKNPMLLTVARLVTWKGLMYSIKAVAKLTNKFPELQYFILGEGEQRKELENLIQELGLAKYVTLHGAATQEQVREHYNLADIFLLTGVVSHDLEVEAQGLVIQEAQSMELPVIVSDAGGAPEGMRDKVTGFVVPPKDIAAIAEKISLLLQNPELRSTMGAAGRQFVQEQYDVQVLHQKLMALYARVLH